MDNRETTTAELLREVQALREEVAELRERAAEHRRVEEQLRQRAESFLSIVHGSAEGISIQAQDRIVEVNQTFAAMFGYPIQETIGRSVLDFVVPADRARVLERIAENDEQPYQIEVLRKDGSTFPAEIAGKSIRYQGRQARMAMIRDIGERRRAEAALRESQERYRAFVMNSSEAIWCFDLDQPVAISCPEDEQIELFYQYGYLGECNQAMAQMYGYDAAAEIAGARLGDLLVRSDPQNVAYLRAFIRAGYQLVDAESHEVDKQNNAKYFLNNLLGIIEDGRLARAWGTQRDITEHKRLYHEAQEAIRTRDIFFSIAAHELRTPLTSLLGHAQLLQRRVDGDGAFTERDRRATQVIAAQAARLNKLALSLLDLSRLQSGQLALDRAIVELGALARRVVGEIQPTLDQHTLVFDGPDDALTVDADELRLEQVLHNLIGNAIKYSPQGGTVTVCLTRQAARVCIAITDQGIGIPAAAIPQLFQRFYRAPNVEQHQINGMGIGLYVVKQILDLHGGTVIVESAELAGSTFTVCLPLA